MTDSAMPVTTERRPLPAYIINWLLISWVWVGVPLGYGVWQTVLKSIPLFSQPTPAATAAPNPGTPAAGPASGTTK